MAVTINDKVIGNHIESARKRAKLTQAHMADQMDMSVSYYSRIECGEVRINLERLMEICVLLGVQPQTVLKHCCSALDGIEDPPDADPLIIDMQRMINSASPETLKTLHATCAALYAQLEKQ